MSQTCHILPYNSTTFQTLAERIQLRELRLRQLLVRERDPDQAAALRSAADRARQERRDVESENPERREVINTAVAWIITLVVATRLT